MWLFCKSVFSPQRPRSSLHGLVIGHPLITAGLRGRLGLWGPIGAALVRRLTTHDSRPMAWTVGTFGTLGNDALDVGDRLVDTWDY